MGCGRPRVPGTEHARGRGRGEMLLPARRAPGTALGSRSRGALGAWARAAESRGRWAPARPRVPRAACLGLSCPGPSQPPTPPPMSRRPAGKSLRTQPAAGDASLCPPGPALQAQEVASWNLGPVPPGCVCACLRLGLYTPCIPVWLAFGSQSSRGWQARLLGGCEFKPPGSPLSEALS